VALYIKWNGIDLIMLSLGRNTLPSGVLVLASSWFAHGLSRAEGTRTVDFGAPFALWQFAGASQLASVALVASHFGEPWCWYRTIQRHRPFRLLPQK
jgi:hypothetical protein